MDLQKMDQILADTAYVRTGGSEAELRCAQYLQDRCAELGLDANLEPFEVDMAVMKEAKLFIAGTEVTCK